MSKATSCHPVSLYRLHGGTDLLESLTPPESVVVEFDDEVVIGEVNCRLVAGAFNSDRPSWAQHAEALTSVELNLPGSSPFGVLLVPLQSWTYALTWGAGHLLLDNETIDPGFGLLFGIRRLDDSRLAFMASSVLDASARSTQTSFPGGSGVPGFRLEPYGEVVNRIAGRADLSGLTYHKETGNPYRIKVGDSLNAPLPGDGDALIRDLRAVESIVNSSDDESTLRFISQLRPVPRGYPKLPELENRLAVAIGGDDRYGPLALAWPAQALDVVEDTGSFKFRGVRAGGPFVVGVDIDVADIVGSFALLPVTDRLKKLTRGRIVACADTGGQEEIGSLIPVRKWIVFETVIDDVRHCYQDGRWLRIGDTYVDQIRDQVANLLKNKSTLTFPLWTPTGRRDDEQLFCQQAAAQPGYLCLDRNFARTPFHPRFELCDVLGPNNELVQVKWLGGAPAASHLITQANVAADAIRYEPAALTELNDKVRALDAGRGQIDPDTMVLAIAGRPWQVDKLFTLSQVSLLRLAYNIRGARMNLKFADIPFVPKKRSRVARAA